MPAKFAQTTLVDSTGVDKNMEDEGLTVSMHPLSPVAQK